MTVLIPQNNVVVVAPKVARAVKTIHLQEITRITNKLVENVNEKKKWFHKSFYPE